MNVSCASCLKKVKGSSELNPKRRYDFAPTTYRTRTRLRQRLIEPLTRARHGHKDLAG